MRTIQTHVYTFEELTDAAKEKARQWYRDGDEFEPEFESVETAAKILGITFATHLVLLTDMKTTRYESNIRWSGFSSQGDGASFVGSYEFARGCSKAIRAEFGTDTELHRIADGLTVLQSRVALQSGNCETIQANVTQTGSSVHKYTMGLEVSNHVDENGNLDFSESELLDLMRDFAQWIYDGLLSDYEDRQSDEAVDDCIICNDYEFTEEGERA